MKLTLCRPYDPADPPLGIDAGEGSEYVHTETRTRRLRATSSITAPDWTHPHALQQPKWCPYSEVGLRRGKGPTTGAGTCVEESQEAKEARRRGERGT